MWGRREKICDVIAVIEILNFGMFRVVVVVLLFWRLNTMLYTSPPPPVCVGAFVPHRFIN